jgi:hypothetical protein
VVSGGLLYFQDGEIFATAAAEYFTGEPDTATASRLMIKIAIEGQPTIAVVDTGAPYLICSPELTPQLEPYLTDPVGKTRLTIRGVEYRGTLYLLTMEFLANRGENLLVPTTVFIPHLPPGEAWNLPSFLGFTAALDRVRFAIDPETTQFYFGGLGDT